MARKQIDELYLVRAFAILAVLAIHATSKPISELNKESTSFLFYTLVNTLSAFAVPAFILLSGLVLLYNYQHRPLDKQSLIQFYKKRLLYIVIPYLLVSLSYFLMLEWLYYPFNGAAELAFKFVKQMFFNGGTFYHLYFMSVIVQFYLLFPLFWWLFQKNWFAKYAIPIGLILQWSCVLLNSHFDIFPKKAMMCFTYFSYFFIGAYIGIYYERLEQWFHVSKERLTSRRGLTWLMTWLLWAASGAGYVFLVYTQKTGQFTTYSRIYEILYTVYTPLTAVILFQLSTWMYKRLSSLVVNVLISIGVFSFAIYFFHPLVQFFYRRVDVSSNPALYHIYIISGFFLVFASSWAVSYLAHRWIPFSWIFFGATPKRPPYKAAVAQPKPPLNRSLPG